MTNDDIDEVLKKNWIELLNPYNDEHILRYQGKFHFTMGRYEQALAELTKLLEFGTSKSFALRYRAETYYMIEKYEESLADLNKLLEINSNEIWVLKAYEEVVRR